MDAGASSLSVLWQGAPARDRWAECAMTEQEEARSRSWEPAARHYRDLTEDERAAYRPREWEQEGAR